MSASLRSSSAPSREAASGRVARDRGWRGLGDQLRTLAWAVLIALAIRAFLVEPYRIPSGSMLPTLLVGDHLFVNKFVYGIELPLVGLRVPGLREPRRGDVVVFTVAKEGGRIHPADRRADLPRERFVKRIVGLPGDHIEVRDEQIWLNGQPVPQQDTGEILTDDVGRELRVVEEQLGDRGHRALYDPGHPGVTGRYTVEPGRYFVMGDNRDDSNDSRKWGTVRLEDFKGPAFVLYWSWDWNGDWSELGHPRTWWTLFTERMRWGRIGDSIR